jgi:hypothetical protein
VQLDADWNEMVDIQQYFLRSLARDVIGPHGGPHDGFMVSATNADGETQVSIAAGHYYVEGILCDAPLRLDADGNPVPMPYFEQPYLPLDPTKARRLGASRHVGRGRERESARDP